MKKSLLILAITFGTQVVNAHPGGTHTHESLLHEWSWMLIPALAVIGLIYNVSKKSYKSSKK